MESCLFLAPFQRKSVLKIPTGAEFQKEEISPDLGTGKSGFENCSAQPGGGHYEISIRSAIVNAEAPT